MSSYIHFITTRFNVRTENWHQTRTGELPLSEEWHEHRFKIFQEYTLPSFKNQKNKNFIWLVFFDAETSPKYRQIIESIKQDFSNFHPVFVKDGAEINTSISSTFSKYYSSRTEFVISTDIDNDDILHEEFVAVIQQNFKPIHNLVIDLRRGFQLSLLANNKSLLTEFYGVANPFVSIVEKAENPKTIMNEKHPNFKYYENIAVYDSKPLFIQLIHHFNLLNNTQQNKALYSGNFKEFGFNGKETIAISVKKTLIHNLKRIPGLVSKRFKKSKPS